MRRAKTEPCHPVVSHILGAIDPGQGHLPAADFSHWADQLDRRYPRDGFAVVYGQLLTAALRLAPMGGVAAAQLFLLATLGLSRTRVAELASESPQPRQAHRKLLGLACDGASVSAVGCSAHRAGSGHRWSRVAGES